jgi:hypothetical protein
LLEGEAAVNYSVSHTEKDVSQQPTTTWPEEEDLF